MLMALGHVNHSIAANHSQHSARTAHRCHEMRSVILNHSITQKLYQRENQTHIHKAMSVPDMATNVSAEGMAELELIEHKSHNIVDM